MAELVVPPPKAGPVCVACNKDIGKYTNSFDTTLPKGPLVILPPNFGVSSASNSATLGTPTIGGGISRV